LLAACGGDGGSATTCAPGDGPPTTTAGDGGDKPTINLAVNPWTASALNVEVAKIIIEENLGNPVEIVSIDENTMFTGMSDGTLDAALEIWPSGVTADEQAFFDDGTVVNIGELGTVGKIGWFTPSYVVDEHPELATWEGYQDPEVAAMFATAETGDNGRFLGTDPSYSQYDEAIIEQLDLPFQVVFSGSEPATVAELDTRFANQEPILMYWWTPTAAVAKYDLVNVLLPSTAPSATRTRPPSTATTPRTYCSRRPRRCWRRRIPAVWSSSTTSPSPPTTNCRCFPGSRSTAGSRPMSRPSGWRTTPRSGRPGFPEVAYIR
jgi:glycine betaine/proline transport system substrate-binding protein